MSVASNICHCLGEILLYSEISLCLDFTVCELSKVSQVLLVLPSEKRMLGR